MFADRFYNLYADLNFKANVCIMNSTLSSVYVKLKLVLEKLTFNIFFHIFCKCRRCKNISFKDVFNALVGVSIVYWSAFINQKWTLTGPHKYGTQALCKQLKYRSMN